MSKRIVSFALWGDRELYVDGAIANAIAYPEMFPGWTCRFYVADEVPDAVKWRLAEMPCEMMMCERSTDCLGLYWRFHPMYDDPDVERFIVRDTDSRPSEREHAAVEEWIESGLPFHTMRDSESHNIAVMGGMWGAVPGCVPHFKQRLEYWLSSLRPNTQNERGLFHGTDQIFLSQLVWPHVRDKCIGHVREGMDFLLKTPNDRFFPVPLGEDELHVGAVQ